MSGFDAGILSFLNQLSQKSIIFDHFVVCLENTNLLKGAVLLAIFWGWWLRPSPDQMRRRKIILGSLMGCAVAILTARVLALVLPFRTRPLNEPALLFVPSSGTSQHTLEKWSSFPSDHAALFIGLATGCYLINRRAGFLAGLYAVVIVLLPRLYLGFHYPTDLLVGALIGIGTVLIGNLEKPREALAGFGLGWLEKSPMSFYICLFLGTYQFAVLFDDVRAAGHFVIDSVRYFEGTGAWSGD